MQVQNTKELPTLSASNLDALSVLVVDDENAICDMLQLFLQHLGIAQVQTANSGPDALKAFEQELFDYVFLDLMMPGMHGLEVLENISRNYQLTNVIIMTGYPSMEVVIDAMHGGAADFLVKPFRFQDIKLTMERLQKLHLLQEKNWQLNQELEKKKEVEELNYQLEKKINLQTILYNIVDSLAKIGHSDNLYDQVVSAAIESCGAKKACFMIYDQGNSHLLALAQKGIADMHPGAKAYFISDDDGQRILDNHFGQTYFSKKDGRGVALDRIMREEGLMTIPFNIREEPFGVLVVGEKDSQKTFDNEDEFILGFLAEKACLSIENIALYDNLKQSLLATLMSLVSAIEAKDPYTQQHSSRVTSYALKIGREMACDLDLIQRLELSGPLHDIGKIGINDNILNKPGRLDQDEMSQIKAHPLIGVNIVSPLGFDPDELAIIRSHHERWDGGGYPDGLEMEAIPMVARILAVADAFDAMSSSRAYRKALPFDKCLNELQTNSGSQFDPEIIKASIPLLSNQDE